MPHARLVLTLLCNGFPWWAEGGAEPRSYYDVLELSSDASSQDARRQFRKLSVKLHPDKNPSANTAVGRAAYMELQRAHEWISNDDKRQLYDLYGSWDSSNDRVRGHQFAGRHTQIEFFRDDPLIRNVRTEAEANEIFGLRSDRAYLMLLYSPWLTSCMDATDVYRKVAANMREVTGERGIRLAAVNCESNLQQFCRRYGRLRNQYELPVMLLLDPTDRSIDRYRGRMVSEQVAEYAIASDKGIRHVNKLSEATQRSRVLGGNDEGDPGSEDFWLVLFCTQQEAFCKELQPMFKRLAYSARAAAKVGLVDCRQHVGADGHLELESFCQEQGVQEVPALVAYRRGLRNDQRGEAIPLLLEEHDDATLVAPMLVLQAMEAVLRLSAPASPVVAPGVAESGATTMQEEDEL